MQVFLSLSAMFFSPAGGPLPLALAVPDCSSQYVKICEEQPAAFVSCKSLLSSRTTTITEQC